MRGTNRPSAAGTSRRAARADAAVRERRDSAVRLRGLPRRSAFHFGSKSAAVGAGNVVLKRPKVGQGCRAERVSVCPSVSHAPEALRRPRPALAAAPSRLPPATCTPGPPARPRPAGPRPVRVPVPVSPSRRSDSRTGGAQWRVSEGPVRTAGANSGKRVSEPRGPPGPHPYPGRSSERRPCTRPVSGPTRGSGCRRGLPPASPGARRSDAGGPTRACGLPGGHHGPPRSRQRAEPGRRPRERGGPARAESGRAAKQGRGVASGPSSGLSGRRGLCAAAGGAGPWAGPWAGPARGRQPGLGARRAGKPGTVAAVTGATGARGCYGDRGRRGEGPLGRGRAGCRAPEPPEGGDT